MIRSMTCRLCGGFTGAYDAPGEWITYGPRHHAHSECFVRERGWFALLAKVPVWSAADAASFAGTRALRDGEFAGGEMTSGRVADALESARQGIPRRMAVAARRTA